MRQIQAERENNRPLSILSKLFAMSSNEHFQKLPSIVLLLAVSIKHAESNGQGPKDTDPSQEGHTSEESTSKRKVGKAKGEERRRPGRTEQDIATPKNALVRSSDSEAPKCKTNHPDQSRDRRSSSRVQL